MQHVLALMLAVSSPAAAGSEAVFKPADMVRVYCASEDAGRTCYGYSEYYPDGTGDACGRVPDGPAFALRVRWEMKGNQVCSTVTASADPRIMPPGYRICSVYLARQPGAYVYRFIDDPPEQQRHAYLAKPSAKNCQAQIEALPVP